MKFLIILVLQLGISCFNLHAQKFDRVEVKGFNVRLYFGYVNPAIVSLFSLTDTVDLEGYTLHAQAQGAEIDYEKGSIDAKLFILPRQDEGYIHFYLEKNGIYYHAKDSIYFEAIKPNPNDDGFLRIMGINKEHPGNKLNTVKHFVLPKNSKVINSDFELGGYDVTTLERYKMIKVKIRTFVTKVIDGTKYYAQQTRNVDEFEIRSNDLKIKRAGKNIFYIAPSTEKLFGNFEVYVNDVKVSENFISILK